MAEPARGGPSPAHRGPFVAGDRVQLTDPKGRIHTIVLRPGASYHTHRGALEHDKLLGLPEGSVVTSSGGTAYLALRPLLVDWQLAMPRGAQVIYPKDVAQIITQGDVFPGARVLEAGAGSGALTCALLRAVGPAGQVVSWELREDFAATARRNVEAFFGVSEDRSLRGPQSTPEQAGVSEDRSLRGPQSTPEQAGVSEDRSLRGPQSTPSQLGEVPATWTLHVGDVAQVAETGFDRVILDLLAPWELVPVVAQALEPGGVFVGYVATTPQLSDLVEGLREHGGFTEPRAWESMVREWHADGLAVRPDHRMVAHTGFLVTARRLAPGVTAPQRRRRPSKGREAYANRRATE